MFLVLATGYAISPLLRGLRQLGKRLVRPTSTGSEDPDPVAMGGPASPGTGEGREDGH